MTSQLDTIAIQGGLAGLLSLLDEGGLTQITPLDIPVTDYSEGLPIDVSNFIGTKTFEISGNYNGVYTVLGSHDGIRYAPLVYFNAGQTGQQGLQQTVPFVVRFVKVRRRADAAVTINMAAQLVCPCS